MEAIIGASVLVVSFRIITKTVGMHAATAWLVFAYWSVFNILNHFDFDSNLRVPVPFPSGVADHQMHHRIPRCNYSKLTMFWDRLFGTYLPYVELAEGMRIKPYTGPRFPGSEA